MKKQLSKIQWHYILFFGSLWGILEATLGYGLHILPSLISGSIMFPIATVIMAMAYKKTNQKSTVIYIAMIAALIKLMDLFVPGVNMIKVINPAMAILVEGLVVSALVPYILSEKKPTLIINVLLANIGWKAVFALVMFGESMVTNKVPSYLQSLIAVAEFVISQGLIAGAIGVILVVAHRIVSKRLSYQVQVRPILSGAMCLMAIICTVYL